MAKGNGRGDKVNIRNLRHGPIGYRVSKGDDGFLVVGDNVFPIARGRAILNAVHHVPRKRGTKEAGKPVTNGEAFKAEGWIAVDWPEPEESAPAG